MEPGSAMKSRRESTDSGGLGLKKIEKNFSRRQRNFVGAPPDGPVSDRLHS
jgi:hypothetical protein